eukprot:6684260-Alexandrium_andersonii.AAC.1
MEGLLPSISSIVERGDARPDVSAPTRMFRIAGLFRDFGRSGLVLKLCLRWIDICRLGRTLQNRAPSDVSQLA